MSSVNYFPNKSSVINTTISSMEEIKDMIVEILNETRMETEEENLEIEENVCNSIILPCMKSTRKLSELMNQESLPLNKTQKNLKSLKKNLIMRKSLAVLILLILLNVSYITFLRSVAKLKIFPKL